MVNTLQVSLNPYQNPAAARHRGEGIGCLFRACTRKNRLLCYHAEAPYFKGNPTENGPFQKNPQTRLTNANHAGERLQNTAPIIIH